VPFDRGAGLSASALRLLREVNAALAQRNAGEVQRRLAALIALAPAHPEVLRVRAADAHLRGQRDESIELMRRALEARPYDAQTLIDLAGLLAQAGDTDGALDAFRRSAEIEPQRTLPLLGMAQLQERMGDIGAAIDTLRDALRREPGNATAHNLLARALQFAGRVDEAQAEYRQTLARAPASAMAWFGLSTVRTAGFDADDLCALERLAGGPLREQERAPALFALAKAYEDSERYDDAFRTLSAANAARRRQLRWDAAKFSANVRAVERAFEGPIAAAADPTLGEGVVFIVGMPRSGSSLIEQILGAHPDVATGGELDDMRDLVLAESQRRESDFPDWVSDASSEDWHRLGRSYLDRVAPKRGTHACFTDKALLNWRYIGAIRAMLPGARFVDCRRNPVETCLGCYRQLFAADLAFTYDLPELAAFFHDYDRAMRFWRQRFPDRIIDVAYERLIQKPEEETRRLLTFCGLAFDEACLRFHESSRAVRTASAAQVREPLRKDTARAERYGTLLDPLRGLLRKPT
jgi:Flp pilus assembly protein TadD